MNTKLICIDDSINPTLGEKELTLGKEYIQLSKSKIVGRKYFKVINDRGQKKDHYASRFITLEEWRTQQLIKLGI